MNPKTSPSKSNSPTSSPRASERWVRVLPSPVSTAPHAVAALLNARDKASISHVLTALRMAGTSTLDLHGEAISTEGIRCLAEVLDEHRLSPSGLHITRMDLSDTQLGSLAPLMDTLSAYGGITSLDFSGAQSVGPDRLPVGGVAGLEERALGLIARLVGNSKALRTLSLNRQPALGLLTHLKRLAEGVHQDLTPPLCNLMKSLGALEELELRDCYLCPQDWNNLTTGVAHTASTLKRLDLNGNDQMASVGRIDACEAMLSFIASLNENKQLKHVILPSPAVDWFRAGIAKITHAAFKAKLALPNNDTLETLSPLTDAPIDDPVLMSLRTRIHQRRELLTLIWCMRENRYGGGVPSEIEKLIVDTALRQPPR